MEKVRSRDGTSIAFDRTGSGPALVLVDGALCHRGFGPLPALAAELARDFTVLTYDRRGRGDSGDTAPFAPEREIEDLAALLAEAGGSASVCGVSSGAALALEAANRGLAITRLALYEAPFIVDDARAPLPDGYLDELGRRLDAGRRGDAVRLFMEVVGVPRAFVLLMRLMPAWKRLQAVAHTLPYDFAFVGVFQRGEPLPRERWRGVRAPTLVAVGGKSPAWMQNAMRALTDVLPDARRVTLPGQTHMVKPKVLAPALAEFFLAQDGARRVAPAGANSTSR